MRKLFVIIFLVGFQLSLLGQNTSKECLERYNLLVSRFGYSGVGIETLLDKWANIDPDNQNMLIGKFLYYFNKSITKKVEQKSEDTYLGQKPILSLKDSLGKVHNYFQVPYYNDSLFVKAVKNIDKAITLKPNSLSLREAEISAYISYEKNSPDIATQKIKDLIDYNFENKPTWTYGEKGSVTQDDFNAIIQGFCYRFFRLGTPQSFEAFKVVSDEILNYEPKNILFLDNIGSYYLVYERNDRKALRYYKKVLRYKEDDITALKNVILLARNSDSQRLEKRYLKKYIEFGKDSLEVKAAQMRLKFLER